MKNTLPPGPKGKLRTTYKVLKDPYHYYPHLVKKYGDPVFLTALNGNVFATGDPKLIQQIIAADPMTYNPFAAETLMPLIGENSLFATTGKQHREQRKLLTPPFHGERMRAYADSIAKVTRSHFEAIPYNKQFTMHDITTEISLEVIVRAVFGIDNDEQVNVFQQQIKKYANLAHPILIFSKIFQRKFFGIGPWDKFLQAKNTFNEMIYQEIDKRANVENGEDILSLLVSARYEDGSKMEKEELLHHLLTLLFAGHETTAIGIAWSLYHLYNCPHTLEKLNSELKDYDGDLAGLVKLPYMKAVCDESLRLNPIVPDFLRTLAKPITVGSYELPAGMGLGILTVVTHYNEDLYPNASEFQPERFLERKYRPWEYLPFGGGHRRCIGSAFALFEMSIVLKIALEYNLELCPDQDVSVVRRNVTMAPKSGIQMVKKQ